MLSILRVLLLLALPLTAQAADEDELLRTLRSTDQTVQDLKTRALNLVNAVEEHRERYHYPDEQRVEVYVTSPAPLHAQGHRRVQRRAAAGAPGI